MKSTQFMNHKCHLSCTYVMLNYNNNNSKKKWILGPCVARHSSSPPIHFFHLRLILRKRDHSFGKVVLRRKLRRHQLSALFFTTLFVSRSQSYIDIVYTIKCSINCLIIIPLNTFLFSFRSFESLFRVLSAQKSAKHIDNHDFSSFQSSL